MKFLPLPNSHNPADYPDIKAAKALNETIQTLKEMLDEYFQPVDGIENGGHPADCEEDDCCLLEFFYYYDPTLKAHSAYRNGIWIRINKDDRLWLFVLVNEKKNKRADLHTATDRNCAGFPQHQSDYKQLPPLFNGPFAWVEKNRVQDITYVDLINEIILRLPCVCQV